MLNEIDLSIVVSIYNVEEYLRECLESIYCLNIKKEIILVNDGSTDISLKIAKEYQEKFVEITTLISKKNEGLSEARNEGLRIARGKYIYFIDSDDFIDSSVFQRIFLESLDENLDILHGNGVKYYSKERMTEIHKNQMESDRKYFSGKDFIYTMYENNSYTEVVWLNIYRRKYLLENHFFFKKGIVYEDTLFSLPVFWNSQKIKYVSDFFYFYRIRPNSIMSSKRVISDFIFVMSENIDFIIKNKICHPNITGRMISSIRGFMKDECVFDEDLYRKIWILPCKNKKTWQNLFHCMLRKYRILLLGGF
ncbi:glycosyltransferase, group 2 family protein [Fusobacterium equinum]|uniref:Glycosyltransferase, group 2 family protein n=1 Tax=Fusobacterium equinum TaxID=134605 RepID=A0A133NGZ5_9FUSO|nr:glycosyltransferase [Fusobacterium equinum]KXA15561.1 glycosyltransferase, group 2 family protein [Fusobacterium equinum]